MALREAYPGYTVFIPLYFYKNDVLSDPLSVADVKIYTELVGGVLVTTITPTHLGVGYYSISWDIPANQTPGYYYDEWTWVGATGMDPRIERHVLTVQDLYSTSTSSNMESRIADLETSVTSINAALAITASQTELRNLMAFLEKKLDDRLENLTSNQLLARISALETDLANLKAGLANTVTRKEFLNYIALINKQLADLKELFKSR